MPGFAELVVIAFVAVFVFGPDELPASPKQAGAILRKAKDFANAARDELAKLYRAPRPEYADLELRDLDPRTIVRKHIVEAMEDAGDVEARPQRRGLRPLEAGARRTTPLRGRGAGRVGRELSGVARRLSGANAFDCRDHLLRFSRINPRRYDDCRVPPGEVDLYAGDAARVEGGQRALPQIVLGRPGLDPDHQRGEQDGNEQGRHQPDKTGPPPSESRTRRGCRGRFGPGVVRGSGHCSSVKSGHR